MKKINYLMIALTLVLGAALLAGCPGKKKPGPAKPAPAAKTPAPKPEGQQPPEVVVAPPDRTPDQADPSAAAEPPDQGGPQVPADIDKPYQPPAYDYEPGASAQGAAIGGSGAITGRILLGKPGANTGNLFVYIPDADSVNRAQPRALASQIITANRIQDSIVDFTLNNVPAGQHMILAIWDISDPHCDAAKPLCAIYEGHDRIGQSDLVEVKPGLKTSGVTITMTSNDLR